MPKFTNTILLAFINVCSFAQQTGSLINKYSPTNLIPHISYVPAKSFTSQSYTGSDSVSFYGPRVASVSGFYISQTEVTNKEYREFTQYVKDSVAHSLLEHFISKTNTIDWNQKIDSKDVRLDSMMIPLEDRLTIFGQNILAALVVDRCRILPSTAILAGLFRQVLPGFIVELVPVELGTTLGGLVVGDSAAAGDLAKRRADS